VPVGEATVYPRQRITVLEVLIDNEHHVAFDVLVYRGILVGGCRSRIALMNTTAVPHGVEQVVRAVSVCVHPGREV